MTTQNNWRRRVTSVLATATAGLLVVGGAVLAPSAAFAEPTPVEHGSIAGATLDWGVKASFRNYIYNFTMFEGRTLLLGTTRQAAPKGTYQWGSGSGVGTTDGSELDISFGANNGVHFQSHPMTVDGEVVYALDMTFTNPRVVVTTPTTGELRMDVRGYEFKSMTEVGDLYSMDNALMATLELPAPTRADGVLTWSGAATTLTEEGSIAFGGFYGAGEVLDPLTFTAQVAPAMATRTTVSGPTGTVYAGGNATVSAQVEPAFEGSFTFFNGETPLGEPVAASDGVASTELTGLAAGANSITATFTPTNKLEATASTSDPVVINAVAPELKITLEDGTAYTNQAVQAGDKMTVKGVGYDPKANVGGRGVPIPNTLPQGVYVVFGEFTDVWKPSAASSGAVRAVGSQGWVLTEDTVNQIPTNYQGAVRAQWVELDADGSFTWEVTLANPTVAVENGHFGIFTYGASGVNNAAQEREVPVNYTTKTSTLALTVPASAESDGTVMLKAAVSSAGAAGKVQFMYGATDKTATTPIEDEVTVVDGIATLETTALPRGANFIKAKFISDDPTAFSNNESSVKGINISTKPTTVRVQTSPVAPTFGDEVTLTANLTPIAATGTVTFFDGDTQIGEPVLGAHGTAVLKSSALDAGSHSITATFTPASADFTASTSAATELTIAARATTTTLTVDPNEVAFGGTAKLTATVSPSVDGKVTFANGDAAIGDPVLIKAGKAELEIALPAGNNVITAAFAPATANHTGSVSGAASVNVVPGSTALVLTADSANVREFDEITLTATVAPAVAGGVKFTRTDERGTTELDTVAMVNGAARLVTSEHTAGELMFGAVFTPENSAEYVAATAENVKVTVSVLPLSAVVNPGGSNTVNIGETVELVAGPFDRSVTHVRILVHSDPIDLGVFEVTDRWVRVQMDWSKLPADFAGHHTVTFVAVNSDGSAIDGAESVSAALNVRAVGDDTPPVSEKPAVDTTGIPGGSDLNVGNQSNTGVKGLPRTGAAGIAGSVLVGSLAVGAGLLLMRRRQHI